MRAMPLSPWLTFRHAKEAIRNGRPEEAHRILAPLAAEGYRKAGRLLREHALLFRSSPHLFGPRETRDDSSSAPDGETPGPQESGAPSSRQGPTTP